MQFFSGDWLTEPTLTLCSPAARGVWIDLICVMHESGRVGELRGTTEQLARFARCSPADLTHALTELQTTGAADVTTRNSVVTVICRRLKRDEKCRNDARLRKQKERGHSHVTDESQTDLRLKSESESYLKSSFVGLKGKATKRQSDKVLAKLDTGQKKLADRFQTALDGQWVNDSGKWVNRIKSAFSRCERVIAEMESAVKESRIKTTPAQYAEQIWKEFK